MRCQQCSRTGSYTASWLRAMIRKTAPGINLVHLLIGHEKVVRDTLWTCLQDERRTLRLVCRALNHGATRHVGQLFRRLYVLAPIPDKDLDVIRVVGPLCHSLTITVTVHRGDGASSTAPSGLYLRRPRCHHHYTIFTGDLWHRLLSPLHQLGALTIRVPGKSGSAYHADVGETLVALRKAVEESRIPNLKTLCLSPIHALGISHLCWSGFGRFGSITASPFVWKQLETLDLRIGSPFAAGILGVADLAMLKKVCYNYLRSFSKTIRILRFVWLEHDGPSPLTLHLETGLEGRPPIRWLHLEELWVGNIWLPLQTRNIAKQLAPSLRSIKMLRSTHRESGLVEPSDSSAWIDLEIGGDRLCGKGVQSRASSVYSQRSECTEYINDPVESVSLSSGSIVVYRDL